MGKYGLVKQKLDTRDQVFVPKINPNEIQNHDLRHYFDFTFNQLRLGSCVDNAVIESIELLYKKNSYMNSEMLSRLYLYYYSRLEMGPQYLLQDSGSTVRDCIKAFNKYGACSEQDWSYSDDPVKFRLVPGFPLNINKCRLSGLSHRSVVYESINQQIYDIKSSLLEDVPIVFGIQVYDSFESDSANQTGKIPMPDTQTENLLGGHGILIVGYDNISQCFIFKNSWGDQWGDKGYGYLPYAYVLSPSLATDFWRIPQST